MMKTPSLLNLLHSWPAMSNVASRSIHRPAALAAILLAPLLGSRGLAAPSMLPTNLEVLVSDFNQDGIPDVLTPAATGATATIAFGAVPYGTFSPATRAVTFPAACNGFVANAVTFGNLVAGDFNGDGFPDLIFTCNTSAAPLTGLMLGRGDGTFAPSNTLIAPYAQGAVAGDFNRDGKLDLVFVTYPNGLQGANSQTPALLFLPGNGDGTFAASVSSPLGTSATFQPGNFLLSSPVSADVDGDTYPDIVLNAAYGYTPTNYNGATLTISVFGNKRDGTFGILTSGARLPDVTAAAGVYPAASDLKVLPGNFFGDARPGFAVPDTGANAGIFLIRNTSTSGSFSLAPAIKNTYASVQNVATATFTGSGFTDLLVSNGTSLNALINDGSGNFGGSGSTPVVFNGLSFPTTNTVFATADANGDGYSDIYTATTSSDGLRLATNLISGSATATSQPISLPVGTTTIAANWLGNLNYTASDAEDSLLVTGAPTATALSSNLNPAPSGATVTFTAAVASIPPGANPTGTVRFQEGSATLGGGNLGINGIATFTTSTLSSGTHSIQAVYSGDESFASSMSATLSQVVTAAAAATPILMWAPAPITQGTPLSPTQLNALATNANGAVVPGTYVYNPAAGTVLQLGSQVLSVVFTPTDQSAYNTASASATISVLSSSQTPLTTNLLLNPGAELGLQNGAIPNWVPAGPGTPTIDNGTFNSGITPHIGLYAFLGQNGASDSLSQTVSLLTQGVTPAVLDSGTTLAQLTFWEQGLNQGTPSDDASVTLTFLDASGTPIGSFNTGEVDSHEGVWLGRSTGAFIPVGTRSITYTMNFIRHAGSDLDAYIDDNSLILLTQAAPTGPTATLSVTSGTTPVSTIAQGSVVTLTASVVAGTSPVTLGQVNFCDTTTASCTGLHLLGTAQLTSAGTATLRFIPAPGAHSYKAIFLGTVSYPSVISSATPLTVTAIYPTATTLSQSGTAGNYTLTATVIGNGGPSSLTGTVSFVDTTEANALLATATLGASQTTLSFTNAASIPTGSTPINVVPADLNGDGKKDLLVGNSGSNTISVLLNNGDGSFTRAASVSTGGYPASISVGDFNNDGKPDFAVTNFFDNNVSIFLGNGDGTFTTAGSVDTGTDTRTVTTADFNRDGKLDLAIGHDNSLSILLGNGDGTFATAASPSTGNGPNYGIAAGDFNGDGIPDIATTNTYENTLSILLGNGDGTFTAAPKPATGSTPVSLAVGDLNGDGKLDIAVADQGDNNVTILLGNGDGTFTLSAQRSVGTNPQGVSIGDLDGDGIADVVTANENSNTVTILLGKGDGTFTLAASPTTGNNPDRAAIADLNGDGIADIATTNVSDGGLTILLTQVVHTATATATGVNPIGTGTHQIVATYSGDTSFAASTSTATAVTAQPIPPSLTWSPAVSSIPYGAPLGPQQLNAVATTPTGGTLPGTYTYTPAAGTVLSAGIQTVRVLFTPTSPNYAPAATSQTITVTRVAPTVSWPTPAAIRFGTAISGTQLNATASGIAGAALPGAFTYTPAAGIVLSAGTQTLSLTFTPADTANYLSTTATQTLTVTPAIPSVTWATPAAIPFGTALSNTQLNATATGISGAILPGTFTYNPAAGTVPPAGTQTLSVTFVPSDTNYTTSSATVTLNVQQSAPTLTWNPSVSSIPYGTPLGPQQLNATSSIPGTFAYTPASGSVLSPGSQTLRVIFTPTSPNYTSTSASQTITVTQAVPTISWPTPSPISQGTALTGTQLNATAAGITGAALPGVFTYNPAAGTVLAAGAQTLSVLFTPTDTANYTTATRTVQLQVAALTLTAISPNTARVGDPDKTITLSGTGFTTGSIVQSNGARIATTFVSATTLTAVVPAASFLTTGTLQIAVANPATSSATSSLPLSVSAPTPAVTLTGPTTTAPGSQPALALTITNPYPLPLTATFTLNFASSVTPAVDDPSIQFANGGRTFSFTVAANSTTVPAIQLQSGTVAGTITIPLTLTAAGVNVTPTTVQPVTITIPAAPPTVSTATLTRNGTQLTVIIHGFSNTREVAQATFHFNPATGAAIDTPDVTVPVAPIFSGWFTSTPSVQYGSTFTYSQIFNVSDTAASIGSVTVTLTNSAGVSTVYSAQ